MGSPRTQQLQSIPVPEMVMTTAMLLHHQLRDAPITGQSNHSMKGEIFWLRAVPRTFLYCTQKTAKLEKQGWPELSLCKGEQRRVLFPTALYTVFPPTPAHFNMQEQGEATSLVLPLVFPVGRLHTAWCLMFLAVKWIQLFSGRTEGTGTACATICSLSPAHWESWCPPVLRAHDVLQSRCKWLHY